MFDFSGKIVLIPGGTGALGSAIVQEFINCNATVITPVTISVQWMPFNQNMEPISKHGRLQDEVL
jgi:NAD(P)-dependent dehydrogenase (short-subunit alcohol dehydrogenase family)